MAGVSAAHSNPRSVLEQVLAVLPGESARSLQSLRDDLLDELEEIRLRAGQPLELCLRQRPAFLAEDGELTQSPHRGVRVSADELAQVVQRLTQFSRYAVEEDMRHGYVTLPGGHRVGIAGRAVVEAGHVRAFRHVTSLNVRISRDHPGAAASVLPFLYDRVSRRPLSSLIVSPPQCGKTTLVRDVARRLSYGDFAPDNPGLKVAVIDERSEIAGSVDGIPQFDLGPRADVLDGCPKAEGMMMAIRSLSPHVVVTDEIGRMEDAEAVMEASLAGVAVVATAHAASLDAWRRRPWMERLFSARAFDRYIVLSRRHGPGSVEAVLDAEGRPLRRGGAAER
ncbi:stage III sporulation protein AA [Alicyclobacillus acidocaldarius subsp. acidocaldarius Tc-4-1]|uniref:Stage III sporulation protein AA n=1 Tax=Alicyclobacillus acidocaldarius (strain Tc-4-1) TaxID=1048834 RepID=F8IL56_ALIAT|nr:stage III sporulation protein AA [Alicyclobacillus acidocaldarius subsp. acidocaldarius Tc-4-1]